MSRIIRGEHSKAQEARYEEGRAAGREEARAQAAALLVQAREELRRYQAQMAEGATSLAVELASSILGEQARAPEVAAQLAQRAWRAAGAGQCILRVHPVAISPLKEALGGLCELRQDETLSPGDCIFEERWGQLDARLTTQLERLVEALRAQGALRAVSA
jgi:flagellar biosynthesis/type III secretory pathway protein FliH